MCEGVSASVSAVKLTEEVEADVFYPITCGDAKATLVWKKFVCPGINVKCVQVCSVIWKQHSLRKITFLKTFDVM